MQIPSIIKVKNHLDQLQSDGLLQAWELPYENLLTRLNAAIFFFTPTTEEQLAAITEALQQHEHFSYRHNEEQQLSQLAYRLTFNEEEKQKNETPTAEAAQ
ncbi:MAG: hypothetical protein AAGG75_02140 [Bacteroidota bacterium]